MQNENYKRLIGAMQLMALPYERQVQILPSFVCVPDEIALIFDESYRLVMDDDSGKLPAGTKAHLKTVDGLLEEMSANKELWTLEALENHPAWDHLRTTAKLTLEDLNESMATPIFDYIQFVKGR